MISDSETAWELSVGAAGACGLGAGGDPAAVISDKALVANKAFKRDASDQPLILLPPVFR
jgi:hypothetical protein